MSEQKTATHNRYGFALGSVAAKISYAVIPVVADDRINAAWDRRLRRDPENQPDMTREIEDFLARYFAPGCRRAA